MISFHQTTKVFAFIFLLFAISNAQDSIYRLKSGTKMQVRMDVEISSEVAAKNDTFIVKTSEPILNGDIVIIPAGVSVEGRVLSAEPASSGGKPGKLSVRFERILIENNWRPFEAEVVRELKAESSGKTSLIAIIGGTAAGAVIGAITKSTSGALIGAGIGAGAGTGVALARKGKNVRIKNGEVFEIALSREFVLPLKDY